MRFDEFLVADLADLIVLKKRGGEAMTEVVTEILYAQAR